MLSWLINFIEVDYEKLQDYEAEAGRILEELKQVEHDARPSRGVEEAEFQAVVRDLIRRGHDCLIKWKGLHDKIQGSEVEPAVKHLGNLQIQALDVNISRAEACLERLQKLAQKGKSIKHNSNYFKTQ